MPAPSARADELPPFGGKGQWLLGGTLGATYQEASQDSSRGTEHLSLWLAPAALHFVARDFALGASLALGMDRYDYGAGRGIDEDSIGGNVLIAYRAGLGASAFLLPQLALGVVYVARSKHVLPGAFDVDGTLFNRSRFFPLNLRYATGDETRMQSTLSLPLCFSPAPAFFFGFGPYIRGEYALEGNLEPAGGDWLVAFGLASVLGSWF